MARSTCNDQQSVPISLLFPISQFMEYHHIETSDEVSWQVLQPQMKFFGSTRQTRDLF
ncbi:Uncharacterized protein TCM_018751 [Theobroma cacao]|uniref:Uncharacterized protein n=1 Tax=Theobroma cacao TaxID=3641 RepID=A0A061EMY5_THECC|nr:Uncharacterized protein TCM_018751 [Theobroma cacao]